MSCKDDADIQVRLLMAHGKFVHVTLEDVPCCYSDSVVVCAWSDDLMMRHAFNALPEDEGIIAMTHFELRYEIDARLNQKLKEGELD